MIEQLWKIAENLHTINVADRKSLDTLVGVQAVLIAMAFELEQKEKQTKGDDTIGGQKNQ